MTMLDENGVPTVFSEPWNDNVSANGIMEYDGRPPRNDDGIDHVFRVSPASSMVGLALSSTGYSTLASTML